MATYIFCIPEKLPSLNEVIRLNRSNRQAGNRVKGEIESRIVLYIKQAMNGGKIKAFINPCEISILWFEKTRRRDVDNIQSSQKFILDALQKAGVLMNDNRKYVKQIHHVVVDSEYDGVQVVLTECEEDG